MHQTTTYFHLLLLLAISFCTQAKNHCPESLAEVISFQGKVDIQNRNQNNWKPLTKDYIFCYGDKIRTSKNSRATLIFKNESRTTLNQNSTLTFSVHNNKELSNENLLKYLIKIFNGSALFRSRYTQSLEVETLWVNYAHKGTEFMVTVDSQQSKVTVFDGQVAAINSMGEKLIEKGYIGIAGENQAPRIQALTIHPEDAVQWTLYYPTIIDYQSVDTHDDASLQSSINANLQNNPYKALTLMEAIPASQQNADYLTLKASLLLIFGSVEEAKNLINKSLVLESDNSTAIALQSIIAVTKNRQDKALNLAKKAVEHDPQSAVAQIALSYAYQSKFDIESALKATNEAIQLSPDNALAWARLSELQLSTGKRSDALKSAEKSKRLNPKLAHTQTILGFANLAQVDIDEAKTAFNQSINLDSADPLARLGLGLAKIRKGDIEEGTSDIETAVSLDPDNAIMRSYLGKAYYELKNDDYAATELAIAKEKDPKDPTPWFYDAIRKQTTNRPVEALHDMQKAIELNDNRGVYRSKLLLDEDLAARSAATGRIYNDLGFEQLGLLEGWNSINTDPTNYSAHRLLADNYASLPRHEIARVSELLQSQLLQPLSLTPIQPQLAESNLLIFDGLGPANLSFNEFNPLFTRDRFTLQASGVFGSNDTYGDEVVHAGLWDRFSYSLGQFHYQTEGFRPNSDLETNLYNAFFQAKLSENANIQFEYRRENTKSGDLRQLFDSDLLVKNRRQTLDRDSGRLGFNININPNTNIIGFGTYGKLIKNIKDPAFQSFQSIFEEILIPQQTIDSLLPFIPPGFNQKRETNEKLKNWSGEIQLLTHWDRFKFITGIGHVNENKVRKVVETSLLSTPVDPTLLSNLSLPAQNFINNVINLQTKTEANGTTKESSNKNHLNGYLYSTIEVFKDLDLTLGVSFDYIDRNSSEGNSLQIKRSFVNPKFGLLWKPFKSTTLRAAWFKTVKRAFASNQTIEPTHVSGFTQFFDDPDSARSNRYGFGLDQQISFGLRAGGELSWRNLTAQRFIIGNPTEIRTLSQKENSHRAYIYWTASQNIAFSAEYFFQSFDRTKSPENSLQPGVPFELTTHKIPLTVTFNHNSGLFGSLVGSFIDQNVALSDGTNIGFRGHDSFWIADALVGFRLPNRWGVFNISIKNVFDQNFNIQEENYNIVSSTEGNVVQPIFVPQRTLFAQFTLAY